MKAEDYKLIPMSEITDEAREIAVVWMECKDKDWIGQKHKLASDIMNYAKKYHSEMKPTDEEATKLAERYAKSFDTPLLESILKNTFKDGMTWKWKREQK